MSAEDSELDPRIQIELENLNSATDEINKLEIELEEANSTFNILLNESTRRLKLSSKKLGNCIEKARPYYDALEKARDAQIECQKAAVKFQRANEIHAAAKETVALAEQRFMSNSHEWQFDNAWQEMLNHATQKVMDAEKQKADCHTEHQRRTRIFNTAEQKVQQLEERFRRSIAKSRPYFDEKQICQDQLLTQKNRIQELQQQVQTAKSTYSTALRNLERISDDIHRQRGDYPQLGTREPGVGAELNSPTTAELPPLPDIRFELEKCDYPSIAGSQISLGASSHRSSDLASVNASTAMSYTNDDDFDLECEGDYAENGDLNGVVDEKDLEALRQRVRILAVRPIEGGDGQQEQNDMWEHELNATVDKLDHLMLLKECAKNQEQLHCHHLQISSQQQQKIKQKQFSRPESLGAECPTLKNNKQLPLFNNNVAVLSKSNNDIDDDSDVVLITPVGPSMTLIKPAPPLITVASCAAISTAVDDEVDNITSLPATPEHLVRPLKKLKKLEPLPSVNVSMRELPLLARLSNDVLNSAIGTVNSTNIVSLKPQRRRSLD